MAFRMLVKLRLTKNSTATQLIKLKNAALPSGTSLWVPLATQYPYKAITNCLCQLSTHLITLTLTSRNYSN